MCSEDVVHTFTSAGGFEIRMNDDFYAKLEQEANERPSGDMAGVGHGRWIDRRQLERHVEDNHRRHHTECEEPPGNVAFVEG
jgi:hypothetical protein